MEMLVLRHITEEPTAIKGNALEAGERSCLIIGPVGPEYTAESSAPEVIALERVLTYWVAVTKAEGTAEITVTNDAGTAGSLTLTVEAVETPSNPSGAMDLSANMDIRLEMVRLINEVRRENGLEALPRANGPLWRLYTHQIHVHGSPNASAVRGKDSRPCAVLRPCNPLPRR